MKKTISIILVLALCLSCCFILTACSDASKVNDDTPEIFDTETKMKIAKLSLESVAQDNVVCLMKISDRTTIKEVVDFLVSEGAVVTYTYIDGNIPFLSVCEQDDMLMYHVKDGVEISSYYSAESCDIDAAKRLLAKNSFCEILSAVDECGLGRDITDKMTIQEVIDLIEGTGVSVSSDYLNTSMIFRNAARIIYFDGMHSTVYYDVEWLDYFSEDNIAG